MWYVSVCEREGERESNQYLNCGKIKICICVCTHAHIHDVTHIYVRINNVGIRTV